jgi:4'-phosphopantetheinyl transferase
VTGAGYLVRREIAVPTGDAWLGERERTVQATLHVAARRQAWRLGRWTAKAALAAWLGVAPADTEVLAAPDGAPEAWAGDERLPVTLSLSHRAGLALAACAAPGTPLGADAEVIEPRSPAFLEEWLSPDERAALPRIAPGHPADVGANAVWTAKEAAAKARREGLRLDLLAARATLAPAAGLRWAAAEVAWPDAPPVHGWWRRHDDHVLTVVTGDPAGPPHPLT